MLAIGILLTIAPLRAEMKEIRVALQFGLFNLPVTVAETQGFFTEEARKVGLGDLKVTVQRFSGGPAMNDALLSGSTDLGLYGPSALLVAWGKTKGRQNVAGLAALAAYPIVLFTNRPEIKSFIDFGEQDRIAVPGSVSPHAILIRMAAEKFYGPGKYAQVDRLLVTMPHPDAIAALLASKAGITGYVASPPFSVMLRKSDKVHAVITSKEFLDGEEATIALLAAGKDFVDANPTVSRVIIAALEDAMAFIARDGDKAADIYIKSESSKIAKQEVLEALTDGTMIYSVAPSGLMKFARFMAKTGQLKNEPKSWQDVFFPFLHGRNGS